MKSDAAAGVENKGMARSARVMALLKVLPELAAQGLTVRQAATKFKVSYSTVQVEAHRLGVVFTRPEFPTSQGRALKMADLYRKGRTLQEIGDRFGLTRERVRQLLRKYTDTTWKDGGAHLLALQTEARRLEKKNKWALRKKGCPSYADYIRLRDMRTPTLFYTRQRKSASFRGIAWEFNLWTWWQVWEASGLFSQRGRGRGKYVMARKGDVGPYAPDNVYITEFCQNVEDYHRVVRGKTLPMGVTHSKTGRYVAHRMIDKAVRHLGTFDTPEQALAAYRMAGAA